MNEYSYLLKDSNGIYTIQNKELQLIDYDGHHEDYNYGFFNVSEILLPKVFSTLEDIFNILICERVKESSPVLDVASKTEGDYSKNRFAIQLHKGDFVLPDGKLLANDCDLTLLPEDITEYSKPLTSKEFSPIEVKSKGEYIFYTVTIDKNEWDSLSRIEVIE